MPSFCVVSIAFKNKSWGKTSGYGQVRKSTNPPFKKANIKLDKMKVDIIILVAEDWRGLLALLYPKVVGMVR